MSCEDNSRFQPITMMQALNTRRTVVVVEGRRISYLSLNLGYLSPWLQMNARFVVVKVFPGLKLSF